jgi:hypothetical protein
MNHAPLIQAAAEVFSIFRDLTLRPCLIGAMAVQRWGEPRLTHDVDVTVLAPFGAERPLIDSLLARFEARVAAARQHALNHRVLLVKASNGVSVDISLAALTFEEEVLARASRWRRVGHVWLETCSAEDLVIYKVVAARPQDLVDVTGVVRRQAAHLDVDRIRYWGRQFAELKEDPELLRPFEEALLRTRSGPKP